MIEHRQLLLAQLGFRFGINGPHAARTMMLGDLRLLLAHTSLASTRPDYVTAVVEGNVLGKPTRKARHVDFHAKLTHHFHRILTHPGS